MDGERHRRARALLQPVLIPDTVNKRRPTMDQILREAYFAPLAPHGRTDLMDFRLYFPIRLIYTLIGFPDNAPGQVKQYAARARAILAGPQVDP